MINGDGCSATCLIEQPDWVCTDPSVTTLESTNGLMADAVVQGGFEDSRGRRSTAWQQGNFDQKALLPLCSEVQCPDVGSHFAADGGFAAVFRSGPGPSITGTYVSQELLIPIEATQLALSLSIVSCNSAFDFIAVEIDGNTLLNQSCEEVTSGFESRLLDISPFADGEIHELQIYSVLEIPNESSTLIIVDNVSIPLPFPATSLPSECQMLNAACTAVETFDAGIPADWTVISLSANPADGWGTTDDDLCLSRNAAGLPVMSNQNLGANLTTGANVALCADSDASGQNAEDIVTGSATQMDTYVCSPALDLSTITGPQYTFNAFYQSKNNVLDDNGTPDNPNDDIDNDFLRVVIGTEAPNAQTMGNYSVAFEVQDHEDDELLLTGAQEIAVNLEGTALEAAAEGYVCFHYQGTFAWFAQVDNAALRGENCSLAPVDSDGDGVFDSTDNCTLLPNPLQIDTNNDGIGNVCDTDIDNNCITAFIDIASFTPKFNSQIGESLYDEDFDTDSDGSINFLDYLRFTQFFGLPPGPSANPCVPGLGN